MHDYYGIQPLTCPVGVLAGGASTLGSAALPDAGHGQPLFLCLDARVGQSKGKPMMQERRLVAEKGGDV